MLEKFSKVSDLKIAIIGDVMVDEYIEGVINRMSPEAPVPIVNKNQTRYVLGGAANVAANIKSLGAQPILIGTIGNDSYGEILKTKYQKEINKNHHLIQVNKPTTVKSRITVKGNQVLRIDTEDSEDNSLVVSNEILSILSAYIDDDIDGVIFQDYNKGVLTNTLIEDAISLCRKKSIPTFVDPKTNNFWKYKNVTVFKPNLKELNDALEESGFSDLENKLKKVQSRLNCEQLITTLADKGIAYLSDNQYFHQEINKIDVVDVSGAGDSTLAMITISYLLGYEIDNSVKLSNISGKLSCMMSGVSPILLKDLEKEVLRIEKDNEE